MTFNGYADYDVIYFLPTDAGTRTPCGCWRNGLRQVRPGTILIAAYGGFVARYSDLGCARVAGNLFLAHTSRK